MQTADEALGAATTDYRGLINQKSAAMKPAIDQFNKTASAPTPAIPDQQKIPEAPKQEDFQKNSGEWVNAMALFAGLVGTKARGHATTALSAFAAGVKGMQAGNQQAFEDAYKTWEGNTKAALDNNKELMEKYSAVLNDRNLSEQEQQMKIKMIASEFGDPLVFAADRFDHQMAIIDSRNKADYELKLWSKKIELTKAAHDEQNTATISDTDIKSRVDKAIASGNDQDAYVGLPSPRFGGSADRTAISEALAQAKSAKGVTGEDTLRATLNRKELQSEATAQGKMKQGITAASNILDRSLPSLMNIAKKYELSSSTDINSVYNFVMAHGSNEDKANFSTQLRAVTTDYALLIGRGRQTVHSDDEALKILHDSMGISSLEGFQKAALQETQNLKEGLDKTDQDLFGSSKDPAIGGAGWKIEPAE